MGTLRELYFNSKFAMGTSQLLFQVKISKDHGLLVGIVFTHISLTLQPPFGNRMAARENELCARVATELGEGSASLKALETEAGFASKHPSELKLVVEGSVSKNLKG